MTTDRILVSRRKPTAKDLEVLQLLAEGFRQKEVGEQLGIKRHTVARRLETMRNHYSATNESLIALAVKLDWVRIEVQLA